MQFNGGKGLAVCSPFQINREGFKRGTSSGGKLDLTALAQYNAAEKEADTVTYIWYGEEEEATLEPKIGLMKTRWGAKVNEPAIGNLSDHTSVAAGVVSAVIDAPTGTTIE